MATGVVNRVLYKMALNPLGNYVFFLAQLQTFGYCLCYFTFLFVRKRQGIVTDEMLAAPDKRLFALNGLLEAMSQLLGLVGAANLPGVVLPLFQQTVLIWTIGFGYVILGKKLKSVQILGALLVGGGVGYASFPAGESVGVLSEVDPKYALIFISSMIFPALSSIIKEKIFTDAKEKLGGKQLDLFVVNSFGSLSQAVFVLLFLPVLTSLRGIPLSGLPGYLTDGAKCFVGGSPSCGSDCSAAPLLPLLYVAFNLAFNISILQLLRSAGNVVQSIVLASIVPITIYAFTLPLPYLPPPPDLGPNFLAGTLILMVGLATYQSPNWLPAAQKRFKAP
ncbi:hypothetical protein WJX84_003484 [Apatococcus fuscideae]|uniref:Uncharacterized protein n=1 Tax=Apatococcus fuscideae TaxID=2026836 RepID=A0AAW1RMB0_9CHLO